MINKELIIEAAVTAFNAVAEACETIKKEIAPKAKIGLGKVITVASIGYGELKEQFKELMSIFCDNDADITVHEFEVLNKQRLIDVAISIKVEGANGIAAYKLEHEGSIYVYLANVAEVDGERTLLPEEQNKYAIIKVEALKGDVIELFGNEQIIILQ